MRRPRACRWRAHVVRPRGALLLPARGRAMSGAWWWILRLRLVPLRRVWWKRRGMRVTIPRLGSLTALLSRLRWSWRRRGGGARCGLRRPSPFGRRRRDWRRDWRRGGTLLLPRSDRRFLCKDALQHRQEIEQRRLVPILGPLRQIRVVDPAVAADMLPSPHDHVLRRRHVHNRCFRGIRVRHPDGYRKAVSSAAKRDRERAAKQQKECRSSILVCCSS